MKNTTQAKTQEQLRSEQIVARINEIVRPDNTYEITDRIELRRLKKEYYKLNPEKSSSPRRRIYD